MTRWNQQRHAPAPGTKLGLAEDFSPGEVKEYRFGGDSPFVFRVLIFNDSGVFKAYWNSCPHFDVPLNHTLDELITSDGKHFLCMTHYAKFDKHTGLCVEGPCEGEYLQVIPLQHDGNQIMVGSHPE